MIRRRNRISTEKITISGSRQLYVILDRFASEGIYGKTVSEVAKHFLWEIASDRVRNGELRELRQELNDTR